MVPESPQRLSASQHLPTVGAQVHVNRPRHDGDTPLHDHDFLEIALVTGGYAIHRTVHGERPIAVGEVFVLHPGQWHAYERCRGLELCNCCIGTGVLGRELAWAVQDPHLGMLLPSRLAMSTPGTHPGQGVLAVQMPSQDMQACIAEFEQIRVLQGLSDPVHVRAEIIARVLLVLSQVAKRVAATTAVTQVVNGSVPEAVVRAEQAMEERLDHAWGLEELAERAGITRFHLVRLFRRHVGCPPMAWLTQRRVEKAAVLLLTTDLPMAEVGQRVGWDDANYFSRRFRAAFRCSPREYRAKLPIPAQIRPTEDWVQW